MNNIPLKAQCIGNLIVELPAQPTITWTQKIDDAEVSRMIGTVSSEQFWRSVEYRRKQLLSLPHETEKTQLGLYETFEKRAALALYRDSDVWTGGYKMDRFLWLDTRGYLLQSAAAGNEIKDQIPRLTEVFSELVERDGAAVDKGFCIDGATVRGQHEFLEANASQDDLSAIGFEHASITVSQSLNQLPLPETAELPITAFEALDREKESIQVSREKFPEGIAEPDFTKSLEILRKRERRVGGVAGQETAFKEVLNNGKSRYKLRWAKLDAAGVAPRDDRAIVLKVGNEGAPAPAGLASSQILSLWDAVLDSIKTR